VCDSPPETYMMCPLCDESLGCHPVDLHGSCMLGKVGTLTLLPVHWQLTFSKSFIVVELVVPLVLGSSSYSSTLRFELLSHFSCFEFSFPSLNFGSVWMCSLVEVGAKRKLEEWGEGERLRMGVGRGKMPQWPDTLTPTANPIPPLPTNLSSNFRGMEWSTENDASQKISAQSQNLVILNKSLRILGLLYVEQSRSLEFL